MKRSLLVLGLQFLVFLSSTALAGDRVVARVGSESVTQNEVASYMQQNPNATRQAAMDFFINRRLMLAWAAGKGIAVGEDEIAKVESSLLKQNNLLPEQLEGALAQRGDTLVSFRENLREQLVINKAVGMVLGPQVRVSDSELQEHYLRKFPRQPTFEVSHILVLVGKDAPDGEDSSAREKIEGVLAGIREGASFDQMAREHSQDTSSAGSGGRLGAFKEGELLPELEQLAAGLQPGEVGGPVRTSVGYHLVRLDSRGFSEPPPFTEVQRDLEKELMAQKEQAAQGAWLEELRKNIYIEILPDDGRQP